MVFAVSGTCMLAMVRAGKETLTRRWEMRWTCLSLIRLYFRSPNPTAIRTKEGGYRDNDSEKVHLRHPRLVSGTQIR